MTTKQIKVSYDFGGVSQVKGILPGAAEKDAVNKGQLDGLDTELRSYVASQVQNLGDYVSKIDATSLPTTGSGVSGAIDKGDWWYITASGTLLGEVVRKGDRLIATVANPNTTNNTNTNTDFLIQETYRDSDSRYQINELAIDADSHATVQHNLGYKFVQVTVADINNKRIDVDVDYIDNNTLRLRANEDCVVSGVVSI